MPPMLLQTLAARRADGREAKPPVAAPVAAQPSAPAAPASPPTGAGLADAQAAASQVMAVLPRAMDLIRQKMRLQIDGPLTVPQFRGLNFVDRNPGCSVSALAAFLGVTLATASAMADRLVRAGHLQARGSPSDRRRSELRIEPGGKAVLERMRRHTRDDLALTLQGRSPQELGALMEGMRVLDAALTQGDPR